MDLGILASQLHHVILGQAMSLIPMIVMIQMQMQQLYRHGIEIRTRMDTVILILV